MLLSRRLSRRRHPSLQQLVPRPSTRFAAPERFPLTMRTISRELSLLLDYRA